MKIKQVLFGCKIATVLVLSSVTFASCSDDDEDVTTPAYVGTWVEDEAMNYAPLKAIEMSEYRDILILSTSTFEMNEQVKYAGSANWIVYTGEKGSLSQNGNIISIKFLEESVTLYDEYNYYTGITYEKIPVEEQETYTAQWYVSNNKLLLNVDSNKDGKYDGENDAELVYIKL